ncbi:DNA primase DnaG [Dissostichus eleginoides]|uniref:DNA primase DnaG n=1 Tax=Dissostichus eleginoides TaxID=100907 RepID=A0AAD9CC84_DISEL|nr:DNA primase DnaG [Dissostichus eleginoides]
MTEVSEGSLPSNMSLEESETDCSEGHDEVVPGRIASSPLDPFPARDFRVKFKKMRQKKRPTILEKAKQEYQLLIPSLCEMPHLPLVFIILT